MVRIPITIDTAPPLVTLPAIPLTIGLEGVSRGVAFRRTPGACRPMNTIFADLLALVNSLVQRFESRLGDLPISPSLPNLYPWYRASMRVTDYSTLSGWHMATRVRLLGFEHRAVIAVYTFFEWPTLAIPRPHRLLESPFRTFLTVGSRELWPGRMTSSVLFLHEGQYQSSSGRELSGGSRQRCCWS